LPFLVFLPLWLFFPPGRPVGVGLLAVGEVGACGLVFFLLLFFPLSPLLFFLDPPSLSTGFIVGT
jgi:hypothetical protein